MPTGGLLLWGTFAPVFSNFIDHLAEIGTASFIFEMEGLGPAMTWCKTGSCLNVYLLWSSDTLQAPKICAVVEHTSFLHRVHMAAVIILLHFLRLVGDGSVSHVEARQKEVRLVVIVAKEAKERSCWT